MATPLRISRQSLVDDDARADFTPSSIVGSIHFQKPSQKSDFTLETPSGGANFRGFGCFRVGKSIFSRYGGYDTKKVPKKCLHVPFRGTLMRARRVTHTPTRHQTLIPWGSIGVAFKGFRTDGSHLVPAGTIPAHRTPPHRTISSHDVARHRPLNKQQIGLLRSNLARGWTDPAGWCSSLDRRIFFC